jgi:hypothetical protein
MWYFASVSNHFVLESCHFQLQSSLSSLISKDVIIIYVRGYFCTRLWNVPFKCFNIHFRFIVHFRRGVNSTTLQTQIPGHALSVLLTSCLVQIRTSPLARQAAGFSASWQTRHLFCFGLVFRGAIPIVLVIASMNLVLFRSNGFGIPLFWLLFLFFFCQNARAVVVALVVGAGWFFNSWNRLFLSYYALYVLRR